MVDATEPLKLLIEPANGADSGTWDQPMNSNTTAVAGMLGGLVTKSFTNANITLTAPAGVVTPGGGPTESQNCIVRCTGTLTGFCQLVLPLPGFYIIDNRCTVGGFYIQVSNGGGGEKVGAPPGNPCHIYSDGTNIRYVNMPMVGSYMDFAVSVSSVPQWMQACDVQPWLNCDGTVYNVATYPFLGAILGSTFGGNGSTTFGVPDLRNRMRVSSGGSRITSAGSGVNGGAIGSAGGGENQTLTAAQMPLQSTGTESAQHSHAISISQAGVGYTAGAAATPTIIGGSSNTGGESVTHTHQVGNASPTAVITLPPTLIAGLTFIKT